MNWINKLKKVFSAKEPAKLPEQDTPIYNLVRPTGSTGSYVSAKIWERPEQSVPAEQLPDYMVKYNNFVNEWNSLERLEREKEAVEIWFKIRQVQFDNGQSNEWPDKEKMLFKCGQERQAELSNAHNEYMKARAEAEGAEIPYNLSKLDTTPTSFVVEPKVRRGRIYAPRKKKEVVVDPMLELFKEIRNEHPEDHITAEIQRLKRALHRRGIPEYKQISIAIRYTKWVNGL
tara:strand:- start:3059 stop:3751 length:693 start_codon:yes stop_codon:yes gene_type:complete